MVWLGYGKRCKNTSNVYSEGWIYKVFFLAQLSPNICLPNRPHGRTTDTLGFQSPLLVKRSGIEIPTLNHARGHTKNSFHKTSSSDYSWVYHQIQDAVGKPMVRAFLMVPYCQVSSWWRGDQKLAEKSHTLTWNTRTFTHTVAFLPLFHRFRPRGGPSCAWLTLTESSLDL